MIDLGTGSTENKVKRLAEEVGKLGGGGSIIVPMQLTRNMEFGSEVRLAAYANGIDPDLLTPEAQHFLNYDELTAEYDLDFSVRFKHLLEEKGATRGKYWVNLAYVLTGEFRVDDSANAGKTPYLVGHMLYLKDSANADIGDSRWLNYYPAYKLGSDLYGCCVTRNYLLKTSKVIDAAAASNWHVMQKILAYNNDGSQTGWSSGTAVSQRGHWVILDDGVTNVS